MYTNTVNLLGANTTLHLRSNDSTSVIENDIYPEAVVVGEMFESFKDKKLGTVIDCGSNVGFYAHFFHERLDVENIIAIEPQPENCELIRLNAPNATVIQAAAGDVPSKGVLNVMNYGNSGATRVTTSVNEGSSINIITIDSLNIENLSFIKIDVEGYELKVLLGAQETIKRCKPVLYVEIHPDILEPSVEAFYDFINSIGYTIEKTLRGWDVFEGNPYKSPVQCMHKIIPS